MDPAEILTKSDGTKDETSAPQAAHWLTHPEEKPVRKLTTAQQLFIELGISDTTEETQ